MAVDVYHEVAVQALEEQMARIVTIDNKTATAFGFATGTLAFVGAIGTLSAPTQSQPWHFWFFASLVVGSLAYLAVLVLLFLAFITGEFNYGPPLTEVQVYSKDRSNAIMREWIADSCITSVCQNEPLLNWKADCLDWGLLCLLLESTFFAIALAGALLSK
jgi:hypothetical protein